MKDKTRLTDFMSIFLTFLLITLLAGGAFLGYVLQDEIRRGRRKLEAETEGSVSRVEDYLNGLIRDEILLGESASDTSWAIKLNSDTDVFDQDFTVFWRQSIQENSLFRPVGLDNAVSRRGMIFRRRSLAVSRTHWGDAAFFVGTLGVPRSLREQVLQQIYACAVPTQIECLNAEGTSCFNRSILFITPMKGTSSSGAQVFLCTVFNAENILKHIEAQLTTGVARFSLVHAESGAVLMESGDGDRTGGRRIEREIFNTPWKAVFEVNTTGSYISQQALGRYLLSLVVIVLVGALLSYLLARWTYRPLQQLLHKVTGSSDNQNALMTLNHSIDSMLQRRREEQQAAAVRQLLMGYFEPGDRLEELVSFREDMYFRVMLLQSGERRPVDGALLENVCQVLQEAGGVTWQASEMLDGGMALILAAAQEEAVHAASGRIQELLEERYLAVSLFFGPISQGLVGVSVSYQEARRKQLYLHRSRAYYYLPFDWEGQLLGAIRQGRLSVAEEILANLRAENERALQSGRMEKEGVLLLLNHLMSDLQRCAREIGLEETLLEPLAELSGLSDFAEMWTLLGDALRRMDEALKAQRGQESTLDQRIVEYIQKHFDQPDLSLTSLQEAFGISSATTINKSIRRMTGQTFQACLIRCRLDRAKELMQDRTLKISAIAQQVGYENEYSFRRSFLRYTGVKVQEYQQSLRMEDRN